MVGAVMMYLWTVHWSGCRGAEQKEPIMVVAESERPLDLTPDEIVERAREIAQELIPRQAETEERRFYGADTHQAFKDAGFYRLTVPRRFGGLEYELGTFYRVVIELCRGCPSTGWQFCLGASHAVTVTSLFSETVQKKIYADPDFICAATARPQGEARRTEGGWLISGTWNYASGIPYSTHFMGHTLPRNDDGTSGPPMIFIAPTETWTQLDDWGASLGRKGSGSHSLRFDDAFVADEFVLENTSLMTHQPDGRAPADQRPVKSSPMYFGGTRSFLNLEGASMSIGTVKGALDVYGELMLTKDTGRKPFGPRSEDYDFLQWYGRALGKVEAAETAFFGLLARWTEAARRNMEGIEPISDLDELRFAAIRVEIDRLCWEAGSADLFRTAGSTPMNDGERMQRIYRDISMARAHAVNTWFDGQLRDLASGTLAEMRKAQGTGATAAG